MNTEVFVTCAVTGVGAATARSELVPITPSRIADAALEVFDTGHLMFAKQLIAEGLIDDPALIQLCLGISYGAPDDIGTLTALVNQLPAGAVFSAFSIGRMQLRFVAMAALAGGNVRVGLEDNIWLERGVKATNRALVERAVTILEAMNVRVLGPDDAAFHGAVRPHARLAMVEAHRRAGARADSRRQPRRDHPRAAAHELGGR